MKILSIDAIFATKIAQIAQKDMKQPCSSTECLSSRNAPWKESSPQPLRQEANFMRQLPSLKSIKKILVLTFSKLLVQAILYKPSENQHKTKKTNILC